VDSERVITIVSRVKKTLTDIDNDIDAPQESTQKYKFQLNNTVTESVQKSLAKKLSGRDHCVSLVDSTLFHVTM